MVKNRLSLLTVGFDNNELSGNDIERFFYSYKNIPLGSSPAEFLSLDYDACLICCEHDLMKALSISEILQSRVDCSVVFASKQINNDIAVLCANEAIPIFTFQELDAALITLYSMHIRLSSINKQAVRLKTTLDDVRLINRAKLLLIERFKMSEKEAHRYIEKTAMDCSQRKRDVAISIIKTYES